MPEGNPGITLRSTNPWLHIDSPVPFPMAPPLLPHPHPSCQSTARASMDSRSAPTVTSLPMAKPARDHFSAGWSPNNAAVALSAKPTDHAASGYPKASGGRLSKMEGCGIRVALVGHVVGTEASVSHGKADARPLPTLRDGTGHCAETTRATGGAPGETDLGGTAGASASTRSCAAAGR